MNPSNASSAGTPASYQWDVESAYTVTLPDDSALGLPVFDADFQRLHTVGTDRTSELRDARTGALIVQLSPHRKLYQRLEDLVQPAVFGPNGKYVATCMHDGTAAHLHSTETGRPIRLLDVHTTRVTSLAFDPSGKQLVTGHLHGSLHIWDVDSGEHRKALEGHGMTIDSLAWSPGGDRIASGGRYTTVRVWDAQDGHLLWVLRGHQHAVGSIAFNPDGSRLVTRSWDLTTRLWDLRDGRLIATWVFYDEDDWFCFTPALHYQGTDGAIARARILIGGVPYPLSSYRASLESPEQVRRTLAGEAVVAPSVPPPRRVSISNRHQAARHRPANRMYCSRWPLRMISWVWADSKCCRTASPSLRLTLQRQSRKNSTARSCG